MKNLLVYINPEQKFDYESSILIKVQIDNSLDLGWKPEDIMLVTNFLYEYNGIKALVIEDGYCDFSPISSKTTAIKRLFEMGLINDLFWVHDLDAYQLKELSIPEIIDMGLTRFGSMPRWSFGSIFFKPSAADIFSKIVEFMYDYQTDEENALMVLTTQNEYWARSRHNHIVKTIPLKRKGMDNINERVKELNTSYNFIPFNIRNNYKRATKPIVVAHFHLHKEIKTLLVDTIDFFFYKKNKINIQIVPDRLIKIFNKHGIK